MENVRVFLVNECDYVITNKNKDEMIEWYKDEYGFDENDETLVREKSLKDTMWYYGEVYELLTFEEVLGYQDYYNGKHKTYVISSTKW